MGLEYMQKKKKKKKKRKKVGESKFYKLAMWASPNFILLNLCDILIIGKIAINSWF